MWCTSICTWLRVYGSKKIEDNFFITQNLSHTACVQEEYRATIDKLKIAKISNYLVIIADDTYLVV